MFVPCPRCNQQNYPNATQCAYCGTPLSPSMIGGQAPPAFPSTGSPGFASGSTGGGAGPITGATASQPQVGQLIDRKYQVERILGEGGMGVVYVALDVNADQRVVIKSIRPEFANRGDFRERTLSEGKALAKIDHQNVVRFNSIINSVETNELYIVMQYIEGESLDRTLEKANAAGQKLPINEVIRVFKQILDGVGAAHKEGLMHRDLKPANVLVRAKDGVAKVMDFGISKAEGATKGPTQAGGIVGSLWYMAPEQIKGARDLDKRLDVYALGIVLYELITGVVPFDGETEYDIMSKHMTEVVPSVRTLRPDAPEWVDAVIQRATQKDRNARFQSCEEMRAMLDQYDGGITVPRSATSYENSVISDHSGSTPGMPPRTTGGGTVAMSMPSGGTSNPQIPAMQYTPAPSQKKGSSLGIILGALVVVGALGGGAAWYFTQNGSDPPKTTATTKEKTKPTSDDDDDKGGTKIKPTGEKTANGNGTGKDPVKKKDPLDELVGTWKSGSSGRELKAERNGDDVDFKIVDPDQFKGAYNDDEVRFTLRKGDDDKSFVVIDRFRPTPIDPKTGKEIKYSPNSFASCLSEFTKGPGGQELEATLAGNKLSVQLIIASTSFVMLGETGVVASCSIPKDPQITPAEFTKQK